MSSNSMDHQGIDSQRDADQRFERSDPTTTDKKIQADFAGAPRKESTKDQHPVLNPVVDDEASFPKTQIEMTSAEATRLRGSEQGRIRSTSSSFARLVRGWEAVARQNDSFQPLQMLQNLSLCGTGEGLARIGAQQSNDDVEIDPFEPIVLRHTHSTPSQYTPMFDDEGEPFPPAFGLDQMRRSSSTPSSTVFRQRSEGSAFGTHLRAMPYLSGPDDRSAFSLPVQRPSYTSLSDSGVRYSAFDPVMLPKTMFDGGENTSIEVTDLGTSQAALEDENGEKETSNIAKKGAASRAAKFLSDVRVLRRRKRRSGRENPARPPSTSSASHDDLKRADSVDEETISTKSSANPSEHTTPSKPAKDTIGAAHYSQHSRRSSFPTVHEADDEDIGNANQTRLARSPDGHYHQLDSDADEEYEHYQGIEASLQNESPTPIPSPAYHQFVDEHIESTARRMGIHHVGGGSSMPAVRIQVSTPPATDPHRLAQREDRELTGADFCPQSGLVVRAMQEGASLTPISHDSGTQSPGTTRSTITSNTSGHTTLATSTSATVSSGHVSVLSTVSETDLEVMETNQAGRMRIRRLQKLQQVVKRDADSSASVHSSSTASTNTHGYLALTGSPAPLREGASLPIDRFFNQAQIPVTHSVSSNSGSTGSSGSTKAIGDIHDERNMPRDAASAKKSAGETGSPVTVSSASMAHTSSSSSADEEPPKFVSYLGRQTKAKSRDKPSLADASLQNESSRHTNDERSSPAQIVGYSEMVFEEAHAPGDMSSQHPTVIRPVQKRDMVRDRMLRFGSRPPLSPIKGLRSLTTPSPTIQPGGPDSESPAYHQLSPPRNIVDHRISSDLSKPYAVFRTGAHSSSDGRTQKMVLVSPESTSGRGIVSTDGNGHWDHGVVSATFSRSVGAAIPESPHENLDSDDNIVYIYNASDDHWNIMSENHGRTYEEMNIEVKDKDDGSNAAVSNIVTPEKGAGHN